MNLLSHEKPELFSSNNMWIGKNKQDNLCTKIRATLYTILSYLECNLSRRSTCVLIGSLELSERDLWVMLHKYEGYFRINCTCVNSSGYKKYFIKFDECCISISDTELPLQHCYYTIKYRDCLVVCSLLFTYYAYQPFRINFPNTTRIWKI